MESELEKLYKKYPKLLNQNRENGREPFDLYGLEVGEGWADILDIVFYSINHYNENPPDAPSPFNGIKIRIHNFIFPVMRKMPDRVKSLIGKILQTKYHKSENHVKITIGQVKEKFGGLRIYVNNPTQYIRGVISYAESLSTRTCEICGSNANVTQNTKGWIKSWCNKCREEDKKSYEL